MMDAVERGLAAVNESVTEFLAGHAGRLQVFTYGPAGGEPRVDSYDFGVHEINGAEWVSEGASIVLSLTRRRRAESVEGGSTEGNASDPPGVTAQLQPPAIEPDPAEDGTVPVAPYRSARGVVPRMPPAPGVEARRG